MPVLPLTVAGILLAAQGAVVVGLGIVQIAPGMAAATASTASVAGPESADADSVPLPSTSAVTQARLAAASRGNERQPRPPSFSLPVDEGTPVSGEFGEVSASWPGGHAGIDFNGETGDPIYAATHGRVTYAEFNYGGYGNLVMIERADGVQTRYAHLDKILVKNGEKVRAGDLIGRMGSTGDSSGSHLHFEVRVGSVPTPTEPRALWSGKKPGTPASPPAWACAKYGC